MSLWNRTYLRFGLYWRFYRWRYQSPLGSYTLQYITLPFKNSSTSTCVHSKTLRFYGISLGLQVITQELWKVCLRKPSTDVGVFKFTSRNSNEVYTWNTNKHSYMYFSFIQVNRQKNTHEQTHVINRFLNFYSYSRIWTWRNIMEVTTANCLYTKQNLVARHSFTSHNYNDYIPPLLKHKIHAIKVMSSLCMLCRYVVEGKHSSTHY